MKGEMSGQHEAMANPIEIVMLSTFIVWSEISSLIFVVGSNQRSHTVDHIPVLYIEV